MSKIPNGAKLIGFRECSTGLRKNREWAGIRRGLVEVWVDLDALIESHGRKALRNKDKTSTLAGGSIVLVARGCRDMECSIVEMTVQANVALEDCLRLEGKLPA